MPGSLTILTLEKYTEVLVRDETFYNTPAHGLLLGNNPLPFRRNHSESIGISIWPNIFWWNELLKHLLANWTEMYRCADVLQKLFIKRNAHHLKICTITVVFQDPSPRLADPISSLFRILKTLHLSDKSPTAVTWVDKLFPAKSNDCLTNVGKTASVCNGRTAINLL